MSGILKIGGFDRYRGWSGDTKEFVLRNVEQVRKDCISRRRDRARDILTNSKWWGAGYCNYAREELAKSDEELLAHLPDVDQRCLDDKGIGIIDPSDGQLLLTWKDFRTFFSDIGPDQLKEVVKQISLDKSPLPAGK